ncbi:yrdC domain-containing protein, mitochondrial [Dorcoceras hygrometricum]|uniref:Threonylcarbamoyl-AMP synthase n=1 Tax=Dorcoceras hygrometricum TaxID=472368 RepID=A0A2Z7AZ02_9LAMI|nr:yrdC domain-containing protein, mitochondrial [Dorcoceras hygrometricum]
MAWRLEKCDGNDMGIGDSGVLRPAMEDYAQEAVKAVKAGKVIVVPNDTLYGFLVMLGSFFALDSYCIYKLRHCTYMDVVHRIYEIKGHKYTSTLEICIIDVEDIQRFAVTDHLPNGLLNSLLPGPVTLVLKRGRQEWLYVLVRVIMNWSGPVCNSTYLLQVGMVSSVSINVLIMSYPRGPSCSGGVAIETESRVLSLGKEGMFVVARDPKDIHVQRRAVNPRQRSIDSYMHRDLTQSHHLMTPTESINGSK